MSQGDFKRMIDDAWTFLEEMAEKTIQWEGFYEKSSIINMTSNGDLHSIKNSISTEA